jgi:hypothetical protein
VVVGLVVSWAAFRDVRWDGYRTRIATFLAIATASHGILDAFASYGEGIGFFQPFTATRFAPSCRPLTALNEVWWIWLPAILAIVLARLRRRRFGRIGGSTPAE